MIIGNEHVMLSAGVKRLMSQPDGRFDGAEIVAEMRCSGRLHTG